MLSGENRMMLNLEHPIPAVGISLSGDKRSMEPSGTIDYSAFVVERAKHRTSPPLHNPPGSHSLAGSLLQSSAFEVIRQKAPSGLFVAEAKLDRTPFTDHVPQVIAEMHGIAKFLG